jgi:hypothetical protein
MSAGDNSTLNQFGAVEAMLRLLDSATNSSVRVRIDALQCLTQLVKSDARARKQLVEKEGVLDSIFASRNR